MVRLYLFAEGQTEQTFADVLMKPHLARFQVFMHNPVLIAHSKKKGRIHRGGGRNYPYIQLHEYETYLFSDPACFEILGSKGAQKVETLRTIAGQYETPELINDGPETAPSKRIIAQFPGYGKTKSVFGPQLAEKIGLQVIRDHCPHFHEWLAKLESLDNCSTINYLT